MDIFSKKRRSGIMSNIGSKNTSVEKEVFKFLGKQGIYFQKHYKKVAGSPDIALPRKKKAIFIDGDFWHGRYYEKTKDALPSEFWKQKIASNIQRDRRNRRILKKLGWKVLRIWGSELKTKKSKEKSLQKIYDFLLD